MTEGWWQPLNATASDAIERSVQLVKRAQVVNQLIEGPDEDDVEAASSVTEDFGKASLSYDGVDNQRISSDIWYASPMILP